MAKLGRSTTICFLFFGVLLLAAAPLAQTRSPIAEQIAKTYGIDSFAQIDAIRYTFNIQFPAVNASRSWVWEPRPDAFPMKKIRTESVIATWAGYKKAGPLLISTD